jgi:hypothetical protein
LEIGPPPELPATARAEPHPLTPITIERLAAAVSPTSPYAWMMKLKTPKILGMPAIIPAAETRKSPSGIVPEITDQVNAINGRKRIAVTGAHHTAGRIQTGVVERRSRQIVLDNSDGNLKGISFGAGFPLGYVTCFDTDASSDLSPGRNHLI